MNSTHEVVDSDCIVVFMPFVLPINSPFEPTLLHENDCDDDVNVSHEVVEHDSLDTLAPSFILLDIPVGSSEL